MLTEVCTDVKSEPPLLPLTEERRDLSKSAIVDDGERADISVRGFWQRYQKAFFDIKVCNLLASSYQNQSITATFSSMEKDKKRKYNARILNVDKGTFTPLVMSVNGRMGRVCSIFYSKLAEQLADKRKETKSETVTWIRRKISFCLLRSAIT